jgi:hypothetical protein
MPAFKAGVWKGDIRLFNILTGNIYAGLQDHVEKFCQERDYDIEYIIPVSNPATTTKGSSLLFSIEQAKTFVKSLILPFEPHQHQIKAFLHAVRFKRALLLSPTASGKSLITYIITRYYNVKTLIIVPTTNLVSQLYSDFIDYGIDETLIHKIFSGQDKNSDKQYFCATWQSLFRLPKSYFDQFKLVIMDECCHPKTSIKMGDGSNKLISEIVEGDCILTLNNKNEYAIESVLKVYKNISKKEKMYEIETSEGHKLKITGNHKVRLIDGKWKRADELRVGEYINTFE